MRIHDEGNAFNILSNNTSEKVKFFQIANTTYNRL